MERVLNWLAPKFWVEFGGKVIVLTNFDGNVGEVVRRFVQIWGSGNAM